MSGATEGSGIGLFGEIDASAFPTAKARSPCWIISSIRWVAAVSGGT